MGGDLIQKELSFVVRGILFAVHNQLGPYRSERQYCDAIQYYFQEKGITYEREKILPTNFVGEQRGRNRVDFLVNGVLILEAKAVPCFSREHYNQCLRYLSNSDAELALLVNFGGRQCLIKRIVSPKLLQKKSVIQNNPNSLSVYRCNPYIRMPSSSKIYTKTGDSGETSLLGGARVKKSSVEMQAIGDVDELNASIGYLISLLSKEDTHRDILEEIQHRLFDLGSLLAASRTDLFQLLEIEEHDVLFLEQWIDQMHEALPPLTQFILPGGTPAAAQIFLVRAVCRRAERSIVALGEEVELNMFLRQYVNRLSDSLFVFGRWLNATSREGETVWKKKET